jgi:hypothetical protein
MRGRCKLGFVQAALVVVHPAEMERAAQLRTAPFLSFTKYP